MANIEVIGRELPKGYSQQRGVLTSDEHNAALEIINKHIPSRLCLRSTAMPVEDIYTDCSFCRPSIIKYSKDIDSIFDPNEIFSHYQNEKEIYFPSADFVIFKNNKSSCSDKIAVVTYSNRDPVLVFEDFYGNIAIGTISKNQLIRYGEWVFKTICDTMRGKVTLTVPICTRQKYVGIGILVDYIQMNHSVYISDVNIWPENPNYYDYRDRYNNAVVVY